jgi:hypothetical protein
MELSEITSALSDAAPYAGAIEALANLGIDITKLITPDTAQANDQQRTQRIQQAADLLSALVADPSPDNADRIVAYDDELCLAAGYPIVGGVSGPTVTVGVQRFLLHESAVAELIALRGLFNQLVVAGGKPVQQPAAVTPPTV